jgi:hypothetical protein
MSTLLTKSIESSIKTAISEATVGLHKKIETQEKEISDLKAESNQNKIENRRFLLFKNVILYLPVTEATNKLARTFMVDFID